MRRKWPPTKLWTSGGEQSICIGSRPFSFVAVVLPGKRVGGLKPAAG